MTEKSPRKTGTAVCMPRQFTVYFAFMYI